MPADDDAVVTWEEKVRAAEENGYWEAINDVLTGISNSGYDITTQRNMRKIVYKVANNHG